MLSRVWVLGLVAAVALGAPATAGEPYVVVVGVGEYKDAAIKARPTAEPDAKALHALLTDPKYLGVPANRSKLLLGADATRDAITKAIDAAVTATGPDDLLIVALFGRGTSAAEKPVFLAADSTAKERAKTGVQVADLEPAFKKLKKQHLLFLMDVQYKGGLDLGTEKVIEPNVGDYFTLVFGDKEEETAFPANRMLVLGNPPFQDALAKGNRGLFATVLLDALSGKADEGTYKDGYESDGVVSAKELAGYLNKEIPNGARAIGTTDKEKELLPVVSGAGMSKFWITKNPAETVKVTKRLAAVAALAKDGKLTEELAKEAADLLARMPKLNWQQALRKEYQKLADGGTVAALETARKDLIAARKLLQADAETYVKQVLPAIRMLAANYIKPVPRGELAALAIKGLYQVADEPLPADIADAIKNPKDLSEEKYSELLTEARVRLGKREDLDGVKASDVTLKMLANGLNDPYTAYITRDEWVSLSKQLEGRFPGVGIIIRRDAVHDALLVVTPVKGGPAFRAGIQAGDLITEVRLEVDGKTGAPLPADAERVFSTKGMKTDDAVKRITGRAETPVTLVIQREGEKEPRVMRILRNFVSVESVYGTTRNAKNDWTYYVDAEKKIGYVRIESFTFARADYGTAFELRNALTQLKKDGLNGLVIDVRNNPGGSLGAVVQICEMFVGAEDIVSIKGRDGESAPIRGRMKGDKSFPIAVLINGNSASASEILAGCLQDHGRAVIIGERSYGKGSVQQVAPYDITEGQLKYTEARYYPPSGRNIDKIASEQDASLKQRDEWGVKPDLGFEVKLTREETADFYEYFSNLAVIPAPGKKVPATDVTKDRQLAKAVEYLKGQIKR
jgi:C-terminal peptidase prc